MNTGAAPVVKGQTVAGMLAPPGANSQGAKSLFAAPHKQTGMRR
jgi:hypothetical protein